jgi:hypothetical protein
MSEEIKTTAPAVVVEEDATSQDLSIEELDSVSAGLSISSLAC